MSETTESAATVSRTLRGLVVAPFGYCARPSNISDAWFFTLDYETGFWLDVEALDSLIALAAAVRAEMEPTTDPCGGNTRGGPGCTCDPSF